MFNKDKIEALGLGNAKLNSQVREAFSLIGKNSEIHNKNVDLIDDSFKKVESELTQIKSEITGLRIENDALRTELTTLKAGKQPKAAASMSEIISREDYYRVTFRDENKGVKTQVEVTPDGISLMAENIVLNDLPDFKGKNISSAQI